MEEKETSTIEKREPYCSPLPFYWTNIPGDIHCKFASGANGYPDLALGNRMKTSERRIKRGRNTILPMIQKVVCFRKVDFAKALRRFGDKTIGKFRAEREVAVLFRRRKRSLANKNQAEINYQSSFHHPEMIPGNHRNCLSDFPNLDKD